MTTQFSGCKGEIDVLHPPTRGRIHGRISTEFSFLLSLQKEAGKWGILQVRSVLVRLVLIFCPHRFPPTFPAVFPTYPKTLWTVVLGVHAANLSEAAFSASVGVSSARLARKLRFFLACFAASRDRSCAHNPEVMWFKSHLRNHLEKPS